MAIDILDILETAPPFGTAGGGGGPPIPTWYHEWMKRRRREDHDHEERRLQHASASRIALELDDEDAVIAGIL